MSPRAEGSPTPGDGLRATRAGFTPESDRIPHSIRHHHTCEAAAQAYHKHRAQWSRIDRWRITCTSQQGINHSGPILSRFMHANLPKFNFCKFLTRSRSSSGRNIGANMLQRIKAHESCHAESANIGDVAPFARMIQQAEASP